MISSLHVILPVCISMSTFPLWVRAPRHLQTRNSRPPSSTCIINTAETESKYLRAVLSHLNTFFLLPFFKRQCHLFHGVRNFIFRNVWSFTVLHLVITHRSVPSLLAPWRLNVLGWDRVPDVPTHERGMLTSFYFGHRSILSMGNAEGEKVRSKLQVQ